jgi:hypothetical protein
VPPDLTGLDKQMHQWSSRLRDDLGISVPASNALAATIAHEVAELSDDAKVRILGEPTVTLGDRLDEISAFQSWMDWMHSADRQQQPALVRAQVLTQNYFCFVYLGESCFTPLRRELPSGSTARRCCAFLLDNPIRAFRNALAHSNWRYKDGFSGLEFWARKGADSSEPLVRFEVSQLDLGFWQAVSRCTAYSTLLTLKEWVERQLSR